MGDRAAQFLKIVEESANFGLREEVWTTPKPGLVDRRDSGSHKDMDYMTFKRSIKAIVPYIVEMARTGLSFEGREEELFLVVREIGKSAEKAMLYATEGVNTHKGAIFSLGIISASLGLYFQRNKSTEFRLNPADVLALSGRIVSRDLKKELESIKRKKPETHGEKLYIQYGISGIRGEAIGGFPSLSRLAVPALKKALKEQNSRNAAYLKVLLHLMSQVDDTNILARSDMKTLRYVQTQAQRFLEEHPLIDGQAIDALAGMNMDFVRRNISPGGCADLLAIAIFLEKLEELWEQKIPSQKEVL